MILKFYAKENWSDLFSKRRTRMEINIYLNTVPPLMAWETRRRRTFNYLFYLPRKKTIRSFLI